MASGMERLLDGSHREGKGLADGSGIRPAALGLCRAPAALSPEGRADLRDELGGAYPLHPRGTGHVDRSAPAGEDGDPALLRDLAGEGDEVPRGEVDAPHEDRDALHHLRFRGPGLELGEPRPEALD